MNRGEDRVPKGYFPNCAYAAPAQIPRLTFLAALPPVGTAFAPDTVDESTSDHGMLYALSVMICVVGGSCETEKPDILYQSDAVCQAQAHILAGRERAYLPQDGEIKYGWRCEQIKRQAAA